MTDRRATGRRVQRAGKAWQKSAAQWLREHAWPHAGYEVRQGRGDIIGTWDLSVECTTCRWDDIWVKLAQSERDAKARGLDLACVWKRRHGSADPGAGAVLMTAKSFFPMIRQLESLDKREMDEQDAYDRGYAAGLRAGKKD